MPISTSCSCGRKLNLKDELAGKMVKCPQCGSPLKVPDGKSTATAVATPPPTLRSAPPDSRIIARKKEEAGPKILMTNFKSLEDFDAAGNVKKKKKTFDEEERQTSEVGNTGGEMAKIAADAMKVTETKPKLRCPGCGKGVKPDDVICMKCGTNIKTGRRIGESGFTLTPKKILLVLAVLAIMAAGFVHWKSKKPPVDPRKAIDDKIVAANSEVKAVQTALEALVKDMDPETNRMLDHVAYLGPDALPILSTYASTGTGLQKRKAVKLLEIMAWNKYRSPESVRALGTLSRDSDPRIRENAVEALFWSSVDAAQFPGYWAPGEIDPAKKTDVQKMYKLPFENCRENLAKSVSAIPQKGGRVEGDVGRRPPWKDPVPDAVLEIKEFAEKEQDQTLKLSAIIQCVRAKPNGLIRVLISYLEPEPNKELYFTPPRQDRERAWRCLNNVTSRTQRRWDDWCEWWKSTGARIYPDLPKKK